LIILETLDGSIVFDYGRAVFHISTNSVFATKILENTGEAFSTKEYSAFYANFSAPLQSIRNVYEDDVNAAPRPKE
jgi:hypothetical protein